MLSILYETFKNTLNEFAFDRKKAIYEITNLCIPYTVHILKLSIFGNLPKHSYDIPKWKDEIFNFVNQASLYFNLKGNKNLKPKDYTDNFFFGLMETEEELENNFKKILKDFPRQGYTIPENINFKSIYQNHLKFVDEIFNDFPEIDYDKVMFLLEKYIQGTGFKC